ncbi:MAG: DUF484 family protein [Cytophagales bacterium]|nr:DUF484 family protein [Cytophagales bacterium]
MTNHTPPLTEDDIADYLLSTPDFFTRHAELLASVQLTHPHSGRAISLADRQIELQREKFRALELQHGNLLRVGKENVALAGKLHQWVLVLVQHTGKATLLKAITTSLQRIFDVPQACIHQSTEAAEVAAQMTAPVCGGATDAFFQNAQIAAALPDAATARSLAVIPLPTVGLLVLASHDPTRFTAEMGTEFLTRLGELAHAALIA